MGVLDINRADRISLITKYIGPCEVKTREIEITGFLFDFKVIGFKMSIKIICMSQGFK